MADVKFQVVRFALSTAASGTQDVTISGFGTPRAALFFTSDATTDDTIENNAGLSIGATDGTREWLASIASLDGQTTTEINHYLVNDGCVGMTNSVGGGFDAKFSFNSWIADGVRLSIVNQSNTARLVTAVLIGGADVANAYVDILDDLSNGLGAIDVTDPNFTPDLVLAANLDDNAINTGGQHASMSWGAAINDGSQTQRSVIFNSLDNEDAGSVTASYVSNTYLAGHADTALDYATQLTAFTATGFTIQSTSQPGRAILLYVALNFTGSPGLSLLDMSWPASGDYAETGPGFTTSFGLISSLIGPTARDTIDVTGGLGFSIAAFDDTNVYTTSFIDYDNQTTSISKSLSSDQLRILDSDGSTNAVVASSYALDSLGWDFALSTNPVAEVPGWALAIESDVAAPVGVTVPLSGQAVTSAQGILGVTASASITLSGQSITAGQQSPTAAAGATVALGSQGVTASQQALSASTGAVVALSGQTVTSGQNGLVAVASATTALGGQTVTAGQNGITVDTGVTGAAVALSGQSLAITQNDPAGYEQKPISITLENPASASIEGSIGQTLAGLNQSATGDAFSVIEGVVGQTLAGLNQSANGGVVGFRDGAISQSLSSIGQTATGSVSSVLSGAISQTIGALSQSATGGAADNLRDGSITQTLSGLSQSATGSAISTLTGEATNSLSSLNQSAIGSVTDALRDGTISQTLAGLSQSASGRSFTIIGGVASQSLPSLSQTLSGSVTDDERDGPISQTLAGLSQSATGSAISTLEGVIDQTLSGLSQTATGSAADNARDGQISQGLSGLSQSASGRTFTVIGGVADSTIGSIGQTASGTKFRVISGQASQSISGLSQSATGVRRPPIYGVIVQTMASVACGRLRAPDFYRANVITQTISGYAAMSEAADSPIMITSDPPG